MSSAVELIEATIQAFGFLILYLFLGFGPGFITGMLLANRLFGRGAPTYMEKHNAEKQKAAEHNSQWNPRHDRWQEP